MSAAKQGNDDLEAVRTIIDAVAGFSPEDQQRIFRWVAEKLKLPQAISSSAPYNPSPVPTSHTAPQSPAAHQPTAPTTAGIPVDIKTFIQEKKPRNDVQFAATVAYYYRFEAPQSERKDEINQDDLQEATRKAGRDRFTNPYQTLNNGHHLGLLDRGSEKGMFTINTVGENLVAMTLPDGTGGPKPAKKKPKKNVAARRSAKKSVKARTQ